MSEYYVPPVPQKLGNPSLDPPMTVRVHPDDDPRSPSARRAIRTTANGPSWHGVTGAPHAAYRSSDVATWPVQHPIVYGTVYRHAAAADARGSSSQVLDGGDAEGDRPFRAGAS